MRALFKELMKASGTPVLQTCEGGVETILSAGNIWTSAHARRIELAERGLAPGAVLCSALGGFQAVIDFVAATIGGFVYLPVTPARSLALRQDLAAAPIADATGILFAGGQHDGDHSPDAVPSALAPIRSVRGAQLALYGDEAAPPASVAVWTGDQLAACLAALSARLGTPMGGTRLTCSPVHHGPGFVVDLLLGLCNRQTIFIRHPARGAGETVVREAIDLEVDDLVLVPPMLDRMAHTLRQLGPEDRLRLGRTRLHTGGRALSEGQAAIASSLFGRVILESPLPLQRRARHPVLEQGPSRGELGGNPNTLLTSSALGGSRQYSSLRDVTSNGPQ